MTIVWLRVQLRGNLYSGTLAQSNCPLPYMQQRLTPGTSIGSKQQVKIASKRLSKCDCRYTADLPPHHVIKACIGANVRAVMRTLRSDLRGAVSNSAMRAPVRLTDSPACTRLPRSAAVSHTLHFAMLNYRSLAVRKRPTGV